jgi:hypothetical protein
MHSGSPSYPVRGRRAVVVNDVFWSPLYRFRGVDRRAEPAQRCWPSSSTRRRLRTADRGSFSHIPSGIDAFSTTHLTHQLAVVPFLNHGPRAGLIALIGDPSKHVELVFAAHQLELLVEECRRVLQQARDG